MIEKEGNEKEEKEEKTIPGQTFTSNEDGTISIKDTDGKEVRYAKESDLLAVKGSREAAEDRAKELEASSKDGEKAVEQLESTRQELLRAEAEKERLQGIVDSGTATAAELEQAKADLETAKKSGEELSKGLLELQRTMIVSTYGVPKATVEEKSSEELKVYAQALADVTGKQLGNYAAGGGSGGGDLSGKSPLELAIMAYEQAPEK